MRSHLAFQHISRLGVIIAIGVIVAACGGGTQPAATTAPTAAAATTAATVAPTQAPAAKLKVAVFGSINDAGFYIANDKGYFKAENLEIEFIASQNAAQGITFLGSGQVDVAGLSATPGLFNAIADGIKVRIVADKARIDPKHSTSAVVVRKPLFDAGTITSLKDLKGKKVFLSAIETTGGADFAFGLKDAGVSIDDVTVVPGSPPDGFNSLKGGAVDAAVLFEPFLARSISEGTAKVLKPLGEIFPNSQDGVVAFGDRLLTDQKLGARFLRAYVKALGDFMKAYPLDGSAGTGRPEIVQILIKNTTVKEEALYQQMQFPYFATDGSIDTASTDKFQQFFIDRKVQKKFIPASDYYVKIPLE